MSRKNNAQRKLRPTESVEVLLKKAIDLHTQGKIKEAASLYSNLLNVDPNNANALYLLGVVYIQNQKYELALGLLERSLEINPSNISAHYNHGLALQSLYRCDKAAISYLAALQIDPSHLSSLTNLGSVYMYLENFSAAEEVFRKLVVLTNQEVNALNNLGLCLFRKGEVERAIPYYQQAYKKNPKHAELSNNLGFALQSTGEFTQALNYYEQAIEVNSKYGKALNNIGSLLFQLQRHDESKQAYIRGSKCKEARAVSHIALAIQAWLNGAYSKVRLELSQVAGFDPLVYSKNQLKFINGYREYLGALIDVASSHPHYYDGEHDLPVIHVIGDSHCLSFHNLVVNHNHQPHRLRAHLIVGCKAWSLVQKESNQYKKAFASAIDSFSENEKVIFTFGEIDCRLDEGIIPFSQKNGLECDTEASKLAAKYVSFLRASMELRSSRGWIFGVPRSIKCNDRQGADVANVIFAFNKTLIDETEGDSYLSTLNSFELADQQGDGTYMIDGVHLAPSVIFSLFKDSA